ncbi:MAG: HutD/Ves family protein [Clostridia bacterium]
MRAGLKSLLRRDHRTTPWSGGTTTELAIYPMTADYKQGNYLWRLSTATVDAETSVFSALPGVTRTLLLLEGQMSLRHEGHHEARLRPFDQDSFEGGWTTHSQGQGRDFNLMCTAGVDGHLAPLFIPGGAARGVSVRTLRMRSSTWLALYCVDGDLTLSCDSDHAPFDTGDIFVAEASRLPAEGELVIANRTDKPRAVIRCILHSAAQPHRLTDQTLE